MPEEKTLSAGLLRAGCLKQFADHTERIFSPA